MTGCLVVAHLVTTGLGPVYDGIGHFFLSLDEPLLVLALAFFAGLKGPRAGRLTLFLLPAAWLAGGIGSARLGIADSPVSGGALLLLLGALAAANPRIPDAAVGVLAAAVGVCQGAASSGTAPGEAPIGLLGLLGTTIAIFVLVALSSALAAAVRSPAGRIVIRVAGSWVAAAGLLRLGWILAGKA
jgi:hypothetical protein